MLIDFLKYEGVGGGLLGVGDIAVDLCPAGIWWWIRIKETAIEKKMP